MVPGAPGYLYSVSVSAPDTDLRQHPESGFARGEEMLTTRDLPVELIEELPLMSEYVFSERVDQEEEQAR